jgi:hypothetical protein
VRVVEGDLLALTSTGRDLAGEMQGMQGGPGRTAEA